MRQFAKNTPSTLFSYSRFVFFLGVFFFLLTGTSFAQDHTISGFVTEGGIGLSGVVMTGLPGNPSTDGTGFYTASVPTGFSDTVTPTLAGYTFTPPNRVYSNVTSDMTGENYTASTNYTISGQVTEGGVGLSGVTMTGLPGTPVTDGSGNYSDTVPSDWSGTVTPTLGGYTFTPVNRPYTNVLSDQTNQNYTASTSYTISGRVTESGVGLSGVTMSGLPGSPVTDGNGDYSDTVNSGWSGTVTPTLGGYSFSPVNRIYSNVLSDLANQDYTATAITYTISGQVTEGGSGLAGVTMTGLPGAPVTDGSGNYSDTVPSGWSGTVTPTLGGYTFTPPNRVYSNVTGDATAENYTASTNYTISGQVTEGGSGLAGVSMTGLPGAPVTDGSGNYSDTVPSGWTGTVTPTLGGYTFTPPNRVYSNVTSDQTGQNYTATLNTYTISGRVTEGGSGLENVVMSGLPGNPATNVTGNYSAQVDHGWSGTVTPTLGGYSFAPPSTVYSNVTSDQLNQDYTAAAITYTISGQVTEGGSGLVDVTMTGLPGSPVTNASGNYTATVPEGWSGTATPTKTGYTFSPTSRPYSNVTSDQTGQNYTATLNTYTISGRVTEGGSGLENVVMSGLPGNPATNATGNYSAQVDHGWSGTVTPTLGGYSFSPPNTAYSNVTSDQLNQDYTAAAVTYTISGQVTEGGSGLVDVTMTGLPGSPVTNASGNYTATVPEGWSGTATPTKTGYTFNPTSRPYSNVTSDQTGQNYTATLNTYTISGRVTEGGSGLENVVMSGLPGNPTTNATGNYSAQVDHGWSGTVTPTLGGYSFAPPSTVYSNVTSEQLNQDYTAAAVTYTISGQVTEGGSGLVDVTMTGLPGSPVTNASGNYTATVPEGWSGTATPTKTGYTFSPTSRPYSNVTSNQTGQNYTATLNTYTISGRVTEGGSGLENVVMSGLPGNPATNATGNYSAQVDHGWSGTVTPTLGGYSFAPPSTVYSNVTSDQTNQDYTAAAITYTISGQVTEGGSGLVDVTMTGLPGSPVTNASGNYTATVPEGWSGTATPTKTGYTFSPTSRPYSNVTSNQTGQNYTATLNTYTISGRVTEGGSGLENVVMSGLPGNPATNATGNYSAQVDHGWSGTVTPTLGGYSFSPPDTAYSNITSDQTNQNYTATVITHTISGRVTEGGSGLVGVTMVGLPGNPTTNANGDYTATVNEGWSGTATPTKLGYTFNPADRTYSNVTSNQTNQDYTATLNTYTISGRVTEGAAGLSGVTMNGLPGNPTTNASGNYSGTVSYGWSGTVTPLKTGYTFSPANTVYTTVASDHIDDYNATLNTYTISGTVTDGVSPLEGVVINGLPGSPTTNSSGFYSVTVDFGFSGTATPTRSGYAFSPASRSYSGVSSNQTAQNYTAIFKEFITSSDLVTVPEGDSATFSVTLSYQPSGTVNATVSRVSGDSDITVTSGSSLSFNSTNWDTPHPVELSAAEDPNTINGEATIRITASGVATKNVTARELDNDTLNFATSEDTVSVPEGASASFTLWLTAQPASNVSVSVAHISGDSDISVQSGSSSLLFTTSDWDTPQPVFLDAAEDTDIVDGSATIRISASGISDKDVIAIEEDNAILNGEIQMAFNSMEGTSGSPVDIAVEIFNNKSSVSSFEFEFFYDDSIFNFEGSSKGSLTSNWSILTATETSPGTIRVQGTSGGGTVIPALSSGSVVNINLQVKCLNIPSDTNTQLQTNNYINGFIEYSPEPYTALFTYRPCNDLGDVNEDGNITPGDAQRAFEIYLGILIPDFCQRMTSDANCNSWTTPGDAQLIFENYLGLNFLPTCCAEASSTSNLHENPRLEDDNAPGKDNQSEHILFALDTIGKSGEIISIPIIIIHPQGIQSFGFDLTYPTELLQFLGTESCLLTEEFDFVSAVEETKGLIRVDGESQIPISSYETGSLVVLVFRVKKGVDARLPLCIVSSSGDLTSATLKDGYFTRIQEEWQDIPLLRFGEVAPRPDGTVKVPVKVSSAFGMKSFGLVMEYSSENLTFLGVEKAKLTKEFVAVDGAEIEPGVIRIGGYDMSAIQELNPGTLFDLIFTVNGAGGELEMVKLLDDLQRCTIQKGKIDIH